METMTAPATVLTETVTPLKPSEAMRLGRLMYPRRCTGGWTDGKGAVCALGAIAVGMGWDPATDYIETGYYAMIWDGAMGQHVAHPITGMAPGSAYGVVIDLNDEFGWPTERIATWLEGLGL